MPPESVLRVAVIGSRASADLAERIASSGRVSVEACRVDAFTEGARNDAAELAARSDILVSFFDDEETARAVMLGPEGVLARTGGGLVLIELSPVSPGFMLELAAKFEAAGSRAYGGALQGHHAYMDSALFEDLNAAVLVPLFAPRNRPTGGPGTSKAMAIVERLVACVNATAAAEAVALAAKAGIQEEVLIPLLLKGSGESQALRTVEGGTLASFQRDLSLAQRLGREQGHSVLFGALALAACRGAAGHGSESEDAYRSALQWFQGAAANVQSKQPVTAC